MDKIVVMGGGTFNHCRNHLSLAAPAFGGTARRLADMISRDGQYDVSLVLTKMANPKSRLVTNEDVFQYIEDYVLPDSKVRGLIMNVAMADFEGTIDDKPPSAWGQRLETSQGIQTMILRPAQKLLPMIRRNRKDIFTVGFKTTIYATADQQYAKGLALLKKSSINLVLANDLGFGTNVIITPEESRYGATLNRQEALRHLATMMQARMKNTFTRSTVVEGDLIPWRSGLLPENLRQVVDYCRSEGAYKPVLGKTVGHFATKLSNQEVITSIRKSNFNDLDKTGMVLIQSTGPDEVIAYGAKPSVGGQSQRIIFKDHPEAVNIVHFHCPVARHSRDMIPIATQWPYECGSHQCGQNTSDNLKTFELAGGHKIKAVMLEEHGPNIVFDDKVPAELVIDFIAHNFALADKTGGLGALQAS